MIQMVKDTTNCIMDRVDAPPETWLLCLQYVCFLLNHTYNAHVNGIPLQHLTGQTMDISPLLCFHFWQHLYFLREGHSFPDSKEGVGRIVGILKHVGPFMTYMVLRDTNKVNYHSKVCPNAEEDKSPRTSSIGGEELDYRLEIGLSDEPDRAAIPLTIKGPF